MHADDASSICSDHSLHEMRKNISEDPRFDDSAKRSAVRWVIVNDGSTDATASIVEPLRETRLDRTGQSSRARRSEISRPRSMHSMRARNE